MCQGIAINQVVRFGPSFETALVRYNFCNGNQKLYEVPVKIILGSVRNGSPVKFMR